jgi:two-component system NtrC family sensor kinase
MTFRIVSATLASLVCLSLSLQVLIQERKNPTRRLFAYSNLALVLWNLGDLLVVVSIEDYPLALFFDRLSYFGALLVATLIVQFLTSYLGSWKDLNSRVFSVISRIFLVSAVPIGLIVWTPGIVKEVRWPPLEEVPGPLFPILAVYVVGALLVVAGGIAYGFTKSTGIRRSQLEYFSAAFVVGAAGAAVYFLTIADSAFPPVYYYLEIGYVLLVYYAIFKFRLMEISVVLRRGLAYAILLGIIYVPLYLFILVRAHATAYSVPPLLAGTLVFSCGLWIFLQKPRGSPNVTFSLVTLGVSTWLFSSFMMYSSPDPQDAAFWGRVAYLGVVIIPAVFFHFSVRYSQHSGKNRLVAFWYFAGGVFLALIPSDLIIDGVYSYSWGHYTKAGFLHPLFLLYFASASGTSLLNLHRWCRESERIGLAEATRARYIFWSFVIGYLASVDFLQTYGLDFYPAGFFFVSLWVMLVTFAIVRYRLLDISVIFSRDSLIRNAQFLLIIPIYALVLSLVFAFTGTFQYLLAAVLVAVLPFFSGFVRNLQFRIENTVGKVLFRERYDSYETLKEFSKAMVNILDLKDLNKKIISTLSRVMGIESVSLFLLDPAKETFSLATTEGTNGADGESRNEVKFAADSRLPKYFRDSRNLVLKEEMEHWLDSFPNEDIQAIVNALSGIGSELCIPLMNKDQLIGFLSLGRKRNGSMYSREDINLLSTLAQSAAIALDNAILYEDLKRQKMLMRRTDRMRSLETMAGGFAHEIRNPLTSIKTFVQLAPQRRDDEEFVGTFSKVVSEDVHRIERLIQEILDYARYMQPRLSEEDLNDVVESSLYFIGVKADGRGITIEKSLASDLPHVLIDRQQIKQVLLNLFLNALDAMANGGKLIVRTHTLDRGSEGEWVQIEIGDTGSGISSQDLEHIFDPFFTTKHESAEREGTGLGLSIVHQIVQEHRGTIEVESRPEEGTTFYVTLPVNPIRHERRSERAKVS